MRLARRNRISLAAYVLVAVLGLSFSAAAGDLADRLRELDARVLPAGGDEAKQASQMLARDVERRLRAANRRETETWQKVVTRADWERFRDTRIERLRLSLGQFPPAPATVKTIVTRTHDGDGYAIDNLLFESRPGWVVTANLYRPLVSADSMPGVLICHSHHNPKSQGELQDMGVAWARLGCLVLVMDQVGHGERRQHPFGDQGSFSRPFRVSRQDYYFRYNTAIQLATIGDSLIGWMVWDLSRGVDLLLAQRGIDRDRIVLLGAVAGGGDPAAVASALDARIAAVVPFNFGGPQPETRFPLPPDAEVSFNFAGHGSWESTRNLRLSARDGFAPWVIVGASAPRGLIYAHEFAWDRQSDPVWGRLRRIFDLYGAGERLDSVNGRGSVSGMPPESTHCNNIGPEHRRGIDAAFSRWFGIPAVEHQAHEHRTAEELGCLTPAAADSFKRRSLHELAAELGAERAAAARAARASLVPAARREELRRAWGPLLGDVQPRMPVVSLHDRRVVGKMTVERLSLEVEPRIIVPCRLLLPASSDVRPGVVVAVAQGGGAEFLRRRSVELAGLVESGVAVCLPDLRGTGETQPDEGRGRRSTATGISSTELMLGQTLVGSRLRDLRCALQYLASRDDLDAARLGIWGDSFAQANAADRQIAVPLDADDLPGQSEPLGGLVALLAGLFEERVRAVHCGGSLTGHQMLLESAFLYVPHDCVVPGALTAGDLSDIAAALAPRPLRLVGSVDGVNRAVESRQVAATYQGALEAYETANAAGNLEILDTADAEGTIAFFVNALTNPDGR